MKSRLPPLRAVEIFVVAGHALSFTAAAKTVNLTPSAVSRRIRDLERDLGATLFRRFNRRLELTAAGARYLDAASRAIDLIARESDAIRPSRSGTTLRLSVLQSLASTWLSPRLVSLKAARPDIDLRIETSPDLVDLTEDRFDAAIRFGSGCWPGLVAERLFEVRVFPVGAPGLLPQGGLVCAAALDQMDLLDIVQAPDLWAQYLAAVGLPRYWPRHTQTFDNAQVMYEAAAHGQGLALAPKELVESQLGSGRLIQPFANAPVLLRQSYYLVYRRAPRQLPALQVLRRALGIDRANYRLR
jgi:LysR family transcriptional regulator, glycine cleavage system transcriptional activator